MLTTQEEAQLLRNLLTDDDDDWVSRRLLEIHYQAQDVDVVARINTTSPVEQ